MPLPAMGGLPRHRAVCADCRTVVEAGIGCDADAAHFVHPLSDGDGRRALAEVAWETRSRDEERRAYVRKLQNRGFMAAGVTGVLTAAWMLLDDPLFGPYLPFLTGFLLLAAFALQLPRVVQRLGELSTPIQKPRGVAPTASSPAEGLHGRIATEGPTATPLLVALELRLEGGETTLRHAWCREHVVRLDDGRAVQVPAGRVRLQAATDRWEALPRPAALGYLGAIDPDPGAPAADGPDTPFPFDEAFLLRGLGGDEVRLESKLAADGPEAPADTALLAEGTPPRLTLTG